MRKLNRAIVTALDHPVEELELTEIIRKHLIGVKTLEPRGSDKLDFHEIHVFDLKNALKAAYEAGRESNPL